MLNIIYFSNFSLNTERFVQSLQWDRGEVWRIPVLPKDENPLPPPVSDPYILVSPSYGTAMQGRVPAQVKKFLTPPEHRENVKAVITTGNRNFGDEFGMAGNVLALKLKIPLIAKIELAGTPQDIIDVKENLTKIAEFLKTGELQPT